jgi:DNA-binding CsgD family transcriptional regulator
LDDLPPTDLPRPAALRGLDARDADLARLIAAGLSDAEIARRLEMGVSDVQGAIDLVLGRLRLRSRSELALLAAGDPVDGPGWTSWPR